MTTGPVLEIRLRLSRSEVGWYRESADTLLALT